MKNVIEEVHAIRDALAKGYEVHALQAGRYFHVHAAYGRNATLQVVISHWIIPDYYMIEDGEKTFTMLDTPKRIRRCAKLSLQRRALPYGKEG